MNTKVHLELGICHWDVPNPCMHWSTLTGRNTPREQRTSHSWGRGLHSGSSENHQC